MTLENIFMWFGVLSFSVLMALYGVSGMEDE